MSTRIEKAKQATIDRRAAEAEEVRPDIEKLAKFGEELLAITGPKLKDHELICFLSDTLREVHALGKTCLNLYPMRYNEGVPSDIVPLMPHGTNSTMFTGCCETAICDDEGHCPRCNRPVIGVDATPDERRKIRWQNATSHWDRTKYPV